MIFEPSAETLEPAEMRQLQTDRLQQLASVLLEKVPYFSERLQQAGVERGSDLTLERLATLPLTMKSDLRAHHPFGLLAVDRDRLARVHASSGTTGTPVVVAYTAADLTCFATVVARSLAMGGATVPMLLHNAYGYGLFTGGLGIHAGAELLGLTVVPVSGGVTERQVTLIQDLRPAMIAATPSYALTIAQACAQRGIAPAVLSLRFAVLGAEPWTESMRREIDASLGVRSTNIYGLSEIIGPGVANECIEARDGSHINEDHFYPEIVDRITGEPLDDGEEGVLVLTTLTKQAMPLLRYWTGDITSLQHGRCACGRTLVRMAPVLGRADDMLIVRGVNLYATQVGDVLGKLVELSPHFQLIVTRVQRLDAIEVRVELGGEPGCVKDVEGIERRAAQLLRDTIGLSMTVTAVSPGSTPRSEGGKLVRVDDRRDR